ncbi:unannotated protein [freshwater metagenome]|uniref:Unannotated protein n=1 Tax=freshwater metagenome TaxID=449393 RepID=A0A6J7R386_9ZZZZ
MREVHRAPEVDVHRLVELVERDSLHRTAPCRSGIVDEQVDAPEVVLDLRRELQQRREVADVDGVAQLGGHLGEPIGPAGADGHGVAGVGQAGRDCGTDARRRPGDQHPPTHVIPALPLFTTVNGRAPATGDRR